jgi:hypothetical protein
MDQFGSKKTGGFHTLEEIVKTLLDSNSLGELGQVIRSARGDESDREVCTECGDTPSNYSDHDVEQFEGCRKATYCPEPHTPNCGTHCTHQHCSSETLVDGMLRIPDEVPCIRSIVRIAPVCRVNDWHQVRTEHDQKVIVSGTVSMRVEYTTWQPERPVRMLNYAIPFNMFFVCDKHIADVKCKVEDCSFELLDCRNLCPVILVGLWGVHQQQRCC